MTRLAYIFIGHVLFVVCLAVSKPAESHKARGTGNELFPFVLVTWPFTKAADTGTAYKTATHTTWSVNAASILGLVRFPKCLQAFFCLRAFETNLV
jgi:hypothetical protein